MRPGEFFEAMQAYRKEKDADRRHQGELIRGMTLRIFNVLVDKKSRYSDPAAFWTMPWDEPSTENKELERLRNLTEEERNIEAAAALKRLGM